MLELYEPNLNIRLTPGCKVKLGRFESTMWEVAYGWYAWGGNRPVCGWYLMNQEKPCQIKPLQLTDLDDIYVIQN